MLVIRELLPLHGCRTYGIATHAAKQMSVLHRTRNSWRSMNAPRTRARSSPPIAFHQICSLTSLQTASHVHFMASLRESPVGVLGGILGHVVREIEPDGESVPCLSWPRLCALATCSPSLAAPVREVLLRELRFVLRDESAVTLSSPCHRRFQLFAAHSYCPPDLAAEGV